MKKSWIVFAISLSVTACASDPVTQKNEKTPEQMLSEIESSNGSGTATAGAAAPAAQPAAAAAATAPP
jgi:hypothetical protein